MGGLDRATMSHPRTRRTVCVQPGRGALGRRRGVVMSTKERRPYHLYPLLLVVLLGVVAVGLYFRFKRPPR